MNGRSRGVVALAACVCAIALLAPAMSSAHHVPWVPAAVVGNSQSKVVVCVATATITATPKTGNLLTGTVTGKGLTQCLGQQGLLRAYLTVDIFQGTTKLGATKICFYGDAAYPPNKQYSCQKTESFSGVGILKVVAHHAYRLPSGSWIRSTDATNTGNDCFISQGDPTGAYCDASAITVG